VARTAMTSPLHPREPARRLLSLDVVRGITIAFMIMVNNNGGSGSWLFMRHAVWNGLTPTDLVFPTFVLLAGAEDGRILGGGAKGMARGLDLDMARLGLQRDCGVHVQRTAAGGVTQRPFHVRR
jgi:hypothetical protein